MPIINTKKDTVAGTITVGSRPLNARHPQHLILSTSSRIEISVATAVPVGTFRL
ncbi:hypothetical protein H7I94_00945 [Mycobacterium szulgai]|nr:hypothetical protein [Mycobacterium szulgai]